MNLFSSLIALIKNEISSWWGSRWPQKNLINKLEIALLHDFIGSRLKGEHIRENAMLANSTIDNLKRNQSIKLQYPPWSTPVLPYLSILRAKVQDGNALRIVPSHLNMKNELNKREQAIDKPQLMWKCGLFQSAGIQKFLWRTHARAKTNKKNRVRCRNLQVYRYELRGKLLCIQSKPAEC